MRATTILFIPAVLLVLVLISGGCDHQVPRDADRPDSADARTESADEQEKPTPATDDEATNDEEPDGQPANDNGSDLALNDFGDFTGDGATSDGLHLAEEQLELLGSGMGDAARTAENKAAELRDVVRAMDEMVRAAMEMQKRLLEAEFLGGGKKDEAQSEAQPADPPADEPQTSAQQRQPDDPDQPSDLPADGSAEDDPADT